MDLGHREQDYRALVEANRTYLEQALASNRVRVLAPLVRPLLRRLGAPFARTALELDERAARSGIQEAARWFVMRRAEKLNIVGADVVPAQGPVVIAANHPGGYDGFALLAAIHRPDIRIIVADVPFFHLVRNLANYFLHVSEEGRGARRHAAAVVVRHLKEGGAVLLFPAGNIEAEPTFTAEAQQAVSDWYRSLDLFAKRVPETKFVPASVSGVLPPVADHAMAKRALGIRSEKQRELFGLVLQMLRPSLRSPAVSVRFAAPLSGLSPKTATSEVREAVLRLLEDDAAQRLAAAT